MMLELMFSLPDGKKVEKILDHETIKMIYYIIYI